MDLLKPRLVAVMLAGGLFACGDDSDPSATVAMSTPTSVSASVSASDPSSATASSTSGESTGTAETGATSTTDAPTTGGEPGGGREVCDRYIECVAVTSPGDLLDTQEDFGPDSPCWSGSAQDAELCIAACKAGLEQGHALAPAEPNCFVCIEAGDCGSGETCVAGGCIEASGHATEIQPIWDANCLTGCHAPGGQGSAWGIFTSDSAYDALVGFDAIEAVGMKRVAPGDRNASYLWHKLNGTQASVGGSGTQMPAPPQSALSNDEMAIIGAWIDAGAPP